MRTNRLYAGVSLVAAAAVAALAWALPARAEQGGNAVYQVTVTNLAAGQLLSPPLVVTHSSDLEVFAVGEKASDGIRTIAEEGNPAVLAQMLEGRPEVGMVATASAPVHRVNGPGPSTLMLTVESRGADRLSVAMMLGCTNDGFTGLSSVRLSRSFVPTTYYVAGLDAGTEANNQLYTFIPEGCAALGPGGVAPDGMNQRMPTDEPIQMHPGITPGQGDLGAVYAWPEPVATITITRVE